MSRKPRELKPNYCYHVTTRCNNREFRLVKDECREILLFAIKQCQEKYNFKLYALCIMSNHVHYFGLAILDFGGGMLRIADLG